MIRNQRPAVAGLTWHVTSLPQTNEKRNAEIQPRPPLFLHPVVIRNGVFGNIS